MYKPLFILVEGADDERFINRIIVPLLSPSFWPIMVTPYAKKTKKELKNYIQAAKKTCHSKGGCYWFIHDKDERTCIASVKEYIKGNKGISNIDLAHILIVIEEIEAWYLAGSDSLLRQERLAHTNNITKEKFHRISQKSGYATSYDCKLSILNNYSLPTAKEKNESLAYCLLKMGS